MSRHLPPLQPRPLGSQSNEPGPAGSGTKTNRKTAPSACEPCRKRKSKCTGERPECHQCVRRGLSNQCKYDTKPAETHAQARKRKYDAERETNTIYRDFFEVIRSRPVEQVNEIVARVRAGTSVQTLMRLVESGDLLVQLAVAPETQYRPPISSILTIPDFFKTPDNPYLTSLVYRREFDLRPSRDLPHGVSNLAAVYDAPYHAACLVDPNIDVCSPSKWTAVPASDEVLREILRCYFMSVYTFLPFFHKEYFIQDLVSGESRFCSSLLVNSVLAAGCRAYSKLPNRSHFWDPSLLQYRFLAEARRLRDLAVDEISITRIQADMVLHLEYGMNGQDKVGWTFCMQAVIAAQDMGLFTAPGVRTSRPQSIVQAMTSWALFSWQGLQSYHQEKAPLITIPPDRVLPTETGVFGEIWVQYPRAMTPVSLHFSETFESMTEFCTILNEIAGCAHPSLSLTRVLPPDQVIHFYQKLHEWYQRLSIHLRPENLIFPTHFNLHMHYWLVTARLMMPFSAAEPNDLLGSSPQLTQSPREIISHANICIRTLMRLYYCRHGDDGYDLFSVLLAQYIGFTALGNIVAPEEGSTAAVMEALEIDAIICARILQGQGRMTHLAGMVLGILLERIPAGFASKLARFINVSDMNEEIRALIARHVETEWPLHVVAPATGVESRRLGNLVRSIASVSPDEDGSSVDDTVGGLT